MFKIQVYENGTDHDGNLFTGYVNIGGEDIRFNTFEAAITFALANSDFFAEFNHYKVVAA